MIQRASSFFIGHGSPMNMLEQNRYTRMWKMMADKVDKPKAIVMISAHWLTDGVKIQGDRHPEMIYDMYGFPDALYQSVYPARTSEEVIKELQEIIPEASVEYNRGYDHGTYSVLMHMYPEADIPVIQLSIDKNKSLEEHYELGKRLSVLLNHGIMVIGSGNIVHNLGALMSQDDALHNRAESFEMNIVESVIHEYTEVLLNPNKLKGFAESVPTAEHYIPLLYAYGAAGELDTTYGFNEDIVYTTLSMSSFLFEADTSNI